VEDVTDYRRKEGCTGKLSMISGVCIIPLIMTFYRKPETIDDMTYYIAAKLIELLESRQRCIADGMYESCPRSVWIAF
jgi:hypothetical protein